MAKTPPKKKTGAAGKRPPFECIALLLQGGGALGAYQCGVYQALEEAGLEPDWVAGVSIGAVNSAIIAGNPPGKRVEALRAFWESITSTSIFDMVQNGSPEPFKGDASRTIVNRVDATSVLSYGVPGFFTPRMPPPWFQESGSPGATSYYDTSVFKSTLEKFVDFDLLNKCDMDLTVSAVNIRTGNYELFDKHTHIIKPEHIMASGALPPAFPAIEIEGEYYWDAGLVFNTPLEWVLMNSHERRVDTLAFQVDLWSSRGTLPHNMVEVMTRQKEILYSSRTRAMTDRFKYAQKMRHAMAKVLDQMPPALKASPEAKFLASRADSKVYNIIHLIYHAQAYEGDSKDYEFSRTSMEDHWKSGYGDTVRTLRYPEVLERPKSREGVFTFDIFDKHNPQATK